MIFIDTGFFFALSFKKDKSHKRSLEIFTDISNKEFGSQITSDYVIDELMTLIWNRTRNKKFIKDLWSFFVEPTRVVNIISFSLDYLEETYQLFVKLLDSKQPLSFTDCSILFLMKKLNIKYLASFDSNFDGLVSRIY